MKTWLLILSLVLPVAIAGPVTHAEDFLSEPEPEPQAEREPAAVPAASSVKLKRAYPGGADEEDLQVQANLPEAALRTDARSLQREVYKSLYNQELKDDRQDAVEE